MVSRQTFLLAMCASGSAVLAAGAEYSLGPTALDHGGLQGGSVNYSASFSAAPGGAGSSSNYRLRSGYAAQLFDPDRLPAVDFISPGSLAADGSEKAFSATAAGVAAFLFTYEGRGFTDYDSSTFAPLTPGLYRVRASAVGQDYIGSADLDFVISGPLAVADALSKPADNSPISIRIEELLANDTRVLADGSVVSTGLSIIGVISGTDNRVSLGESSNSGPILFTPSPATTETFYYVVSDGVSSANGEVTVTALDAATALSLQISRRGIPVFDGSRTTLVMNFIGVPGQNYQMEWSLDLGTWFAAGTSATGPTGSFAMTLSLEGNHLTSWNRSMFFRAKR